MREIRETQTPGRSLKGKRDRRAFLAAAAGAAAGATAATLLPQTTKRADAAPGDWLVLGRFDNNSGAEATGLSAAVTGPSPNPPDPGFEPDSTLCVMNTAPTPGADETAKALSARSSGEGVAGFTTGDGPHSVGVFGASVAPGAPGEPDQGWGPAPGVAGASGSGPGVEGQSDSGPGVHGVSHGTHQSPGALDAIGVLGDSEHFVGVLGISQGGPPTPESAGGTGVYGWNQSGTGAGVVGASGIFEGGYIGVIGHSAEGVGVQANSPAGIALNVQGKARFSTAGAGVVPARANFATVPNPAVTAASHITVTFTSDPGGASVAWVERQPDTGFVVHLSGRARSAVPFTYLIVEPGA